MICCTAESHVKAAINLYQHRCNLLQQSGISIPTIISLEQRLRVHLYVLASMVDMDEAEPETAPETFVYAARRLIDSDKSHISMLQRKLMRWLLEPAHVRITGVLDAFTLFPVQQIGNSFALIFKNVITSRHIIMQLWLQMNSAVTGVNLSQLVRQKDRQITLLALEIYINDQELNLENFTRYYRMEKYLTSVDDKVLALVFRAVWVGVTQRDPSAIAAIYFLLERLHDDIYRFPLLRILALTGDNRHFDMLKQACNDNPELYFPLLGLYAGGHVVEELLVELENLHAAKAAAVAWKMITGETLPTNTRLNSMSGADNNMDEHSDADLPDAESARQWWHINKGCWKNNYRYHSGKIMTADSLLQRAKQEIGTARDTLYDLLAITEPTLLKLPRYGWHEEQIGTLNQLTVSNVPLTIYAGNDIHA